MSKGREDDQKIVQIMPAGGWCERWGLGEENDDCTQPLVGWGLTNDGQILALVCDDHGSVETFENYKGTSVFHPDATEGVTKAVS